MKMDSQVFDIISSFIKFPKLKQAIAFKPGSWLLMEIKGEMWARK